jgi:phosphoglycerate-specific signal transduction histidine kinase
MRTNSNYDDAMKAWDAAIKELSHKIDWLNKDLEERLTALETELLQSETLPSQPSEN